jgi:hypothetical protein
VPTARELLDQADALMRRNRPASPTPAEDGIPTLMDAVQPAASPGAPREAPSARALVREEAANDLDDVPLLTDAVEEIEAPSILEEPPDDDDPATWDDTLTGAHTIIPAVPLELPPVPEATIGVLPEEREAAPAAHAGPTLAVETIEIPPPRAEAAEPAAPAATLVESTPPEPPAQEAITAEIDALLPLEPAPYAPAPPGSTDETVPNLVVQPGDESDPATPFEWPASAPAPQPPVPESAPAFAQSIPHASPAHAEAAAASFAPVPAPAAPVHVGSADDEARWSALAEEIRMQVLQRIDLFTDTGLREQLSARLQPIVDRASADLVATINQHVGVLLRAYVAEAIEREIERWRAERR